MSPSFAGRFATALLVLLASGAPAAPLSTRFSTTVGSGGIASLAVSGNRLYVGGGSALYVLDVGASGTPPVLGQVSTGAQVTAVHVQGTTVYAGTAAQAGAELRVIDASTPASPTQVGALELGVMVTSIVSQGTTLYVGAASPDGENPANGLRVVSVATPSNPTQLMETFANTRVFGLKVYGNRLLGASNPLANDISVLQVWNIANPQSPTRLVGTAAGRTVRAYWVDVAGQHAFAGQYHGQEDRELGVFDLSALPALSSPTAVGFSSRSFAGAISGSYLFAGLEARAPTNLEVVDVSHGPTALRLEGYTAGTNGRVNAVAVAGTTAYLGFDTGTLIGVDVSKYLGPDTTPPTVALQQPVGGAPLSGRIGLAAVATDDVRVTQVDFAVDGSPIGVARNQSLTAPFVVTWDTAGVSDGPHTVTATARDNGGNATTSTITVTVANAAGDQLPPTVSLINPRPAETVAHALLLSASAEDNFAVTQVRYRIDGVDFGAPVTAAPWRAVLDSTQLSDGTHSLVAVATDAAGNATTSAPVSFTVDNRPAWYSAFTPTREVYVSPSGTGNGASAGSPSSLASAVASAQPGDLVWLAAGTYPTPLPDLTRAGTSARPIVWRAQAGARAILPGEWLMRATYNWVWGLELYGLSMQAAHTRAINNTVRVGLGLTPWDAGPGMVAYGNIIFEDASTGLAMHNIYTQNDYERDGYKYFSNRSRDQRS